MTDGYVHPDFGAVTEQLAKIPNHRHGGGGAVCVYHHGEKVVDAWVGSRNKAGDPWLEDTITLSFSTGKGVVSTAIHMLADRGQLSYDDPVSKHWPEFAQAGKENITIAQVMTHTAGLHRVVDMEPDATRWVDWDHMVATISAVTPAYEPGTRWGYHGITYAWLAGEIVRRVSGLPVDEYVSKEIASPLGLDGLFLYVPPPERGRLAQLVPGPIGNRTVARKVVDRLHRWGATREAARAMIPHDMDLLINTIAVYDAPIPSFNGVFTARSIAAMYAAISLDGSLDGVRLVSPRTVREMAKVRSVGRDGVVGLDMHWRLGYHLVGTRSGILPDAFGHFGYGGSGGWADPTRELAVSLTCNRVAGSPFGDMRILNVCGAAVAAADRRDGRRRRFRPSLSPILATGSLRAGDSELGTDD